MNNIDKTVSIVIPALNEESSIEKVVRALPSEELQQLGYKTQVIVVDNASEDSTAACAKRAGANVVFEARRGYGRAYKAGFAAAHGDIILTLDADMTYPAQYIPELVRMLDEGVDFITTDRFTLIDKGIMPFINHAGNFILTLTMNLLFRTKLKDSQSGMWVFRKSLFDKLILRSNGMALSEEIKIEAIAYECCNWREIPIVYSARFGKVKLNRWRDGFLNLAYLFKKRVFR